MIRERMRSCGDTGAALGGLEREYASNIKECSSSKAFIQVLASGDMESLSGGARWLVELTLKADSPPTQCLPVIFKSQVENWRIKTGSQKM
jgi:hypothetical protein